MDMWVKFPEEYRYKNRRENHPSFSSTLLDSIYRSIDDQSHSSKGEKELIFTTMAKKHSSSSNNNNRSLKEDKMTTLERACMIEKWMEKKANPQRNDFDPMLLNSSSTSSDSSSGGWFSSSEADSIYGAKSRSSSSSSSHYTTHRPKPIRTGVSSRPPAEVEQKPNHEGGFVRTKSKALKIYSDLKRVKQPISPGGRLASFLNSLFIAGNTKKTKIPASKYEETKLKSDQATTPTCSSTFSYSRSCLSKTPSTGGNGTKRSVRFCPVNVILDDENTSHENMSIKSKPTSKEIEFRIMEENRRVVEAAKDLLKSYRKEKEEYDMRDVRIVDDVSTDDGEGDDDDTASYASSDLFELNNLSAIGVERYREELPVYETTYLDTNRVIANGLFV